MPDRLADVYRRFAEQEARGRSELYPELAGRVAGDRELLELLSALPRAKQQPNLLFAAVRLLCGTPAGWEEFRACVAGGARRCSRRSWPGARRPTSPPAAPRCCRCSPACRRRWRCSTWERRPASACCLIATSTTTTAGGRRRSPPRPAALAAEAPAGATLVVFHMAVLAYVADPAERAAFADAVRRLGAVWVANEGPGVLADPGEEPRPRGRFLLTCNGRPVAWTDPHGTTIEWLG